MYSSRKGTHWLWEVTCVCIFPLHESYELMRLVATPHAVALLQRLLPRSPVSASPILRIISVLGEQSNNKALHRGRVEYKAQKKALEGLNVLLEVGAVSREGSETLQRFWGVIARGLEYGTLRWVLPVRICRGILTWTE